MNDLLDTPGILELIFELSGAEPVYKLRDWIPLEKLNIEYLNRRPEFVATLEQRPELIKPAISYNVNAVHIIENMELKDLSEYGLAKNPHTWHITEKIVSLYDDDEFFWDMLSRNKNAIGILEKNIHKITGSIGKNPAALHLINKKLDPLVFMNLIESPWMNCEKTYEIFRNNIDRWDQFSMVNRRDLRKISEEYANNLPEEKLHILSADPEAIPWLNQNPKRISLYELSANPGAASYIIRNFPQIRSRLCLKYILQNPAMIEFIKGLELTAEQWFDDVSKNPAILEIDKKATRKRMKELADHIRYGKDYVNKVIYIDDYLCDRSNEVWFDHGGLNDFELPDLEIPNTIIYHIFLTEDIQDIPFKPGTLSEEESRRLDKLANEQNYSWDGKN